MFFPSCPFSLGLLADKGRSVFLAKETGNPQGGGSGIDGRAIEKKELLALVRRRGAVSQPVLHGMGAQSISKTQESG